MKGSVRKRLLAGTGIGVGLAMLISGVLVFVLVKRALVSQFDDALLAKGRALSILVEIDDGQIEFDDISREAPPGDYFELYSPRGESLLRSKSLGDAHLERADGDARIGGAQARQRVVSFTPRGEDVDVETTVVRPTATFAIARSTVDLDATIAHIRNILIGVGFGALLLCIGILAWISRYGLAPVDRLAADIAAIREDKLDPIDRNRPIELVPIVDRLNELLARVDRTLSRERALTAEVAHELRTPLAGLRATIELALDRDRPTERYRSALDECLKITTQTERMVESMLSLAKLDAGNVSIDTQDVRLDELVGDVVASHAARADIRVTKTAVTVRTDPVKLASVLHNLVDNAITYGDSIEIDVADRAIRISNGGCTLDTTDHVFDRFWRGDAARTAGTHAGLGLSICKTLVGILGGTITATIRDRRFIVTVVLPATSETNVDSLRSPH